MQLKAEQRRKIADRAAEIAVDEFVEFYKQLTQDKHMAPHPEEFLELQHNIEDLLYREFA